MLRIGPGDLRVIRCYQRLPPRSGGMETHIQALSNIQTRENVEVVSVFNSGNAPEPYMHIWPSLTLDFVKPAIIRDIVFYSGLKIANLPHTERKHTVMHIHGDYSAFAIGKWLSRRLGIRHLFASFHGRARASASIYSSSLRNYSYVFATGFAEYKIFKENIAAPVAHTPSPPKDLFFNKWNGGPLSDVISVGSLVKVKQFEIIVQCAIRLPNLKFSIYGEGPERPKLEKLIEESRCNNITIHGSASSREIAAAMQSSRVFINVSSEEGTPTAALEALASGLPVVLTPANDYSFLVQNGYNGYITSGWDLDEILSFINICVNDERNRRIMSNNARSVASRYNWHDLGGAVTEMMLRAISIDK